jgi:hypothetical protein
MKKTYLILIIVLLFLSSFIYAEVQTFGSFKKNSCISLLQSCSNCSYVNISSISTPSNIIYIEGIMKKQGVVFNYTFCNTSYIGKYIVTGHGNLDGVDTIWNYDFYITNNGKEEDGNTNLGIIFIILGVIIVLLIINFQLANEHILIKIFFYYIIFALISILPSIYFITEPQLILNESINRLIIVFWVYVATFIIYFILKKAGDWIK